MKVAPVLLGLTILISCGGSNGDAHKRFEEGIEGNASCSELFEFRNELDPDDSRIPAMNEQLREIGCFSSGSERTD